MAECSFLNNDCMEKITITIDDLNAAISAAVNAAMEAYLKKQKKDVLVPRLVAARLLKKSPATLWRWEKDSYLIPVRQGSSVMYKSGDLARLGVELD